ncbi:MAG TPA: ATP-dependent endonuclease [Pirellulales bacterium]|jgi:hypothetical protein|nr:ATP-dependent endonuclease [Pirellulales bacterium]
MKFTVIELLRTGWLRPKPTNERPLASVVLVVEGMHDMEFLRRISRVLHAGNQRLPDLGVMEQAGQLLFLPSGGGDVRAWAQRFAVLSVPRVYLFDRELPPETGVRLQAAAIVNQRANCRGFVTAKRAPENYLHASVLLEIRGIDLAFGDQDDVPERVARDCCAKDPSHAPWEELTSRARRRLRDRAKRWLNREAVDRMTPERQAQRDPNGEVRGWLATIAELAGRQP